MGGFSPGAENHSLRARKLGVVQGEGGQSQTKAVFVVGNSEFGIGRERSGFKIRGRWGQSRAVREGHKRSQKPGGQAREAQACSIGGVDARIEFPWGRKISRRRSSGLASGDCGVRGGRGGH